LIDEDLSIEKLLKLTIWFSFSDIMYSFCRQILWMPWLK
jgi:hypothetical protein